MPAEANSALKRSGGVYAPLESQRSPIGAFNLPSRSVLTSFIATFARKFIGCESRTPMARYRWCSRLPVSPRPQWPGGYNLQRMTRDVDYSPQILRLQVVTVAE